MSMRRIRFKGKRYLLVGGAIATDHQYRNGLCSYAHLSDGIVWRFRQQIGTAADIQDLGPANVQPDNVGLAILNAISDPSWEAGE